ncbi:MAG TPA: MlaD family protein, partial [Thermoleophilaceae bacterium]|nr:MlaD family protein [Thermoleophilaceae bacterium]
MKRAIKAHLRDFLAVLGLLVLAVAIGGYILSQQRFRFPLLEDEPKVVAIELQNAQAVQPGQGQTVRVAGVEIGKISDVEVEDGLAVVEVEIEREFEGVIREDATALLRPRTGLKDMLIEVDPGQGDVLAEGERISVGNTLPDVNPDEVISTLDADTRPYLRLLVSGAGKGLRGRGDDLAATLERLEPLHRDLARVTRASARRRDALRRLVTSYGSLMQELGRHPAELRRLVSASGDVFEAITGEESNISEAVSRLPGTLRQTERTLARVETLGDVLRPSLEALRAPFRELVPTNAALRPFLRETTPIVRDQIRPFARAGGPYLDDVEPAARDLATASPDLTKALGELNRFFNMGAYNPGGAEPPRVVGGNDLRQEGFLYWLAWTANNGVSLFSTADAQGVYRRLTICGLAPGILGAVQLGPLVRQIAAEQPALAG